MPQHPFPDPGPDHEEPDRSPLSPAAEGDGPAEQGLYLCRPPEQLTLAGFAQNGGPAPPAISANYASVARVVSTAQNGSEVTR